MRHRVGAAALLAGALAVYACAPASEPKSGNKQGAGATAPSATPTSEDEALVHVSAESQSLAGLRTTLLEAAALTPEVKAYGSVVDPAPLVALSGDIASARAALEASSREHQRLMALFSHGQSASAKAVEGAEAAMKRDRIALDTAETQLISAWGQGVAGQSDLRRFVQSLARRESALVRLDLPPGESLQHTPSSARLVARDGGPSVSARLLGRAPTTDPRVPGEGFLFVVTHPEARLTPGLAVTGLLQSSGERLRGVIVPESAVVRSDEQAWVYVQTGADTFERRAITPSQTVVEGWFVTSGVAPGDRVVTTGAQALLSETRRARTKLDD